MPDPGMSVSEAAHLATFHIADPVRRAELKEAFIQQHTTVPERPPVPFAKVEQIVDNIRELLALKDQERVTQAQIIRWCVRELRSDPDSHRIRGHEGYAAQQTMRAENRRNKALALLYLEWLATKLEGSEAPKPEAKSVR